MPSFSKQVKALSCSLYLIARYDYDFDRRGFEPTIERLSYRFTVTGDDYDSGLEDRSRRDLRRFGPVHRLRDPQPFGLMCEDRDNGRVSTTISEATHSRRNPGFHPQGEDPAPATC